MPSLTIRTATFVLCVCAAPLVRAQDAQQEVETVQSIQQEIGAFTCPGDPPGNLASLDCNYTKTMRAVDLVGPSLTDQAVVSAAFFGLIAQSRKSPSEWDRGWQGYGRRFGTRYGQNVVKGVTVFAVGALMKTDPRHVSYASDPLVGVDRRTGGAWTRIGHAAMDWATVRQTSSHGNGRRRPNLPMFAGAMASAYVGNLWYPARLTTTRETTKRAAASLGTALFASFYKEFSPELGRVLGRLVSRGSTRPWTAQVQP